MSDSLLMWSAVFAVSLVVLIKASDRFTEAAEKLGLMLGVPSFIIGVTIVAMGTSLPELVSSFIAAGVGSPEIVVGNVVGSNITNIFLVLGVAAVIGKDVRIDYTYLHLDLAFLLAVTAGMALLSWDGTFSRLDAVACCVGMVAHIVYNLRLDHSDPDSTVALQQSLKNDLTNAQIHEGPEYWGNTPEEATSPQAAEEEVGWKLSLVLVVASFFIYIGAKFTVDSVIEIARILDVGKEVVAISAVALGTSLPELSVTVRASMRGKADLAVGNVLGSNIFNTLYVMGLPAFVAPLPIPPSLLDFGMPVFLITTGIFVVFCLDRRFTRREGIFLLAGYVVFLARLFTR